MEKRVLYAVLNWGLGHATRSVPIIESLLFQGAAVEIASNGAALKYLKSRFPELTAHVLPDREVRYSRKGAKTGLVRRALSQLGINRSQHRFTKKLVSEEHFTHIVSDNVYGARHPQLPSALISHQLSLKVPFGESRINQKLGEWINRFDHVWIPDTCENFISGDLGHSQHVTVPVEHLGLVSRFSGAGSAEKKYVLGAVLGGPEPQRTVLEDNLLSLFPAIDGKKVVFRGSGTDLDIPNAEVHALGDGAEMAEKLRACELVIGRSGFSTISDLLAIGAKGLLIPTPGQTEQEYLAERMNRLGWFSVCGQNELSLEEVSRVIAQKQESAWPRSFKKNDQTVVKFLTGQKGR